MQLSRGQKVKIGDLTSGKKLTVELELTSSAGLAFDLSCFGIDAEDKLSDDRYFIFFNQKTSPCGSLSAQGDLGPGKERFQVNLDGLPQTIRKLVFTATVDGDGTMGQVGTGSLTLREGATELARFNFSGSDFQQERAVMVGEIYFKDLWRLAAVGQGFNGGLSALLKNFGGEAIEDAAPAAAAPAPTPASAPTPAPAPAPASSKISLVKKMEKEAPRLVNLAKTLTVSLEKRNLQEVVAKVALVLDASGSMSSQYRNGDVQLVIDRTVPLAIHFDDDGELEAWAFAEQHTKLKSVTLRNIDNYVRKENGGWERWVKGPRINNEVDVMKSVIREFRDSRLPVYVLFISDGGVSRNRDISNLIVEASRLPIFWQFVGIGGRNYGVLQQLDTLHGRFIDNCNFFALDDIKEISDSDLYDRLLNEFPAWLKLAKEKGVLR